MILVGFFEAFGSAWAYDLPGQIERQSAPVVLAFWTANFGAVILGCVLWFSLEPDVAVWAGFVGFFGWYFTFVGVTGYFMQKKLAMDTEGAWTMQTLWWEVYFGNILILRNRMQEVIGRVPFLWCVLMKHFIPHVLVILFVNLAQSKTTAGLPLLRNYGGCATVPYQVLGILVVTFTLVLFTGGVIFPDLYSPLALPQTEEAKQELEKSDQAHSGVAEEVVEKAVDGEVVEKAADEEAVKNAVDKDVIETAVE